MKAFINYWPLYLWVFLLPGYGLADDNYAYPPAVTRVAINQAVGSLVEFPSPIKVVADTAKFTIEMVPTESDKDGAPVDVTIVKVTARYPGAEEVVPFILTGKKTVTLRFFTKDGASKHQKIITPRMRAAKNGNAPAVPFLEKELSLMRLMLRDEEGEGFQRNVQEKAVAIAALNEDLKVKLVRQFEGHSLYGYVLQVSNLSDKPVQISPKEFRIASSHRSALLQVDTHDLQPCQVDPARCVSALRLVIRAQTLEAALGGGDLPFRLGEVKP